MKHPNTWSGPRRALVLALMLAWMLPLSEATYAFGDLLFHGLLKQTIEDRRMPDVAPSYPAAAPCSDSASAGASRHHTAEELEEDAAGQDTTCGDPRDKTAALPWENGDVTVPLDINEDRCTAATYIAAAQAQLSDDELTALDKYCRGKADRNPLRKRNARA